jgi:ankyrin repeat protein
MWSEREELRGTLVVPLLTTDKDGWTALHLAAVRGDANIVERLIPLVGGCDVRGAGGEASTAPAALALSAGLGHVDVSEVLLSTGVASINFRDWKTGRTALHVASGMRMSGGVRWLMTNVPIHPFRGRTPPLQ